MRVNRKTAAIGGAAAAAAIGAGVFFAVSPASAAHSIVASPDNPVYWQCHNNTSGALTGLRKYDGSGAYPSCGSAYTIYYWHQGPNAPTTPSGPAATVTAQTAVSDRDDSGLHGNWAKDAMVRTITVTRQHAAAADKCGPNASQCWFYTGTLTDQGSFRSTDGASSPNAGTPINGNVSGTMTGGAQVEFYADSDSPSAANVPSTLSGSGVATSKWAEQLFPAGTNFAGEALPAYDWTYAATSTCEQFAEHFKGSSGPETDTGDIQGVNHCTN
jgi:hypothetical protein